MAADGLLHPGAAPPSRESAPAWSIRLAWLLLALAALLAALELLAGPAYRLGWASLKTGLSTMRWAATSEVAVLVVAALGTLLVLRWRWRRAARVYLSATVLAVLAAVPPAVLWYRVQHLPRMHDVSTDMHDPPAYAALLPLRRDATNPSDYDAKLAPMQEAAYPDVRPAVLAMSPEQTLAKALDVAHAMGWDVVDVDRSALRIEATDTSLLFGFKDDVVVRIRGEAGGSRVDVRSLSRVGGSDFGVNAKRVVGFLTRLQQARE